MIEDATNRLSGWAGERVTRKDALLLAAFCLLLFGFTMFDGKPLSLHSARLPEIAREMMRTHDWLVPRSGGRPWLERPPMPHWIAIGISAVLGQHCDSVWVVRLPSVLMGTCTVLLTAWIGAMGLGRTIGLVGGYALATSWEFYDYSGLSEEDIYVAAFVAVAIALFVRNERQPIRSLNSFGPRHWSMFLMFIVLGAANMVKSPFVAMAAACPVIGIYLLWNFLAPSPGTPGEGRGEGDLEQRASFDDPNHRDFLPGYRARGPEILRYFWFWGIAFCLALTVIWPYLIYRRYPATLGNWSYDYSETNEYDNPFWYYPIVMAAFFMPWAPFAVAGLLKIWRTAWETRRSFERFLLCWAIVPVLVFTIPHRKHHHYLVPSLAPWGLLAAVGLREVGRWLAKKGRSPQRWFAGAMVVLLAGYCVGQIVVPDSVKFDTAFLKQADRDVPAAALLTVNSDLGGDMMFFRNQFYVRPTARLLHNLTFLRDDTIHDPVAYVITRASDQNKLKELGDVQVVTQSIKTHRERSPADRFTLFKLTFDPSLQRYPAPAMDSITTMQAMGRKAGPYCGPASIH